MRKKALPIALDYDRSAFDATYVALAVESNAPLVTADEAWSTLYPGDFRFAGWAGFIGSSRKKEAHGGTQIHTDSESSYLCPSLAQRPALNRCYELPR